MSCIRASFPALLAGTQQLTAIHSWPVCIRGLSNTPRCLTDGNAAGERGCSSIEGQGAPSGSWQAPPLRQVKATPSGSCLP